ncbi:hypothetical protein D0S45_17990 [Marinifilum sp. JC120]|nr:hypothetical protein D0S45_17990 [Marinifilum sp. JC120]
MTEKPLLWMTREENIQRPKRKPIFRPVNRPEHQRQLNKFSPKFSRLGSVLSKPNARLELKDDPTGIAPDRALVFEVVGLLSDFAKTAKSAGLEFLGSFEEEYDPDEDFYYTSQKTGAKEDKSVSGVVYLAMPDLKAMEQLYSLWRRYQEGKSFETGQGQWKTLFANLKDVRPWGPQDRVTDNFITDVEFWMDSSREKNFLFEMDLWFSNSTAKQQAALVEVRTVLENLGGRIVHSSRIPEVQYYGVLAELSNEDISFLKNVETNPFAKLDAIMHLSPRAMALCPSSQSIGTVDIPKGESLTDPVAALIDGYPYARHNCLSGRISVDDFLNIEARCPANNRHHGTAMASLILHGDLHNDDEPSLDTNLVVIPVLQTVKNDRGELEETTPDDQLAIDVIYNAVKRLKEGVDGHEATAPDVVVINHSLGDPKAPYANRISPWAKVLDYLAFKYKVLFVVSAGNHSHKLDFPSQQSIRAFEDLPEDELQDCYFKSIALDMRNRTLLPPAEAINAMTVGAWHADACEAGHPRTLVDVLPQQNGPSPISAVGLGHKRAIKPDLFYDGGRILGRIMPNGDCCAIVPLVQPTNYSGQQVAAPSVAGDSNATTNLCGTSNATALITRKAIQLNEMLDELEDRFPESFVPQSHRAVMLKALLAHGCRWPKDLDKLDKLIEPIGRYQHSPRRTNIARLLGMGRPDISRVLSCTAQRATLIFWDNIVVDRCHKVRIPLPPSLSAKKEIRTLTTTLAWLSPINSRHQQYRQAVLDLNIEAGECGVERKKQLQAPNTTIERGTLIHNIYEGTKAVALNDDIEASIICRQQAGHLDVEVPYALVVSFEVGVDSEIDVYEEACAYLGISIQQPIAP